MERRRLALHGRTDPWFLLFASSGYAHSSMQQIQWGLGALGDQPSAGDQTTPVLLTNTSIRSYCAGRDSE